MGLDFHNSDDKRREEVLFSLSHEQFLNLREPLSLFKAMSGVEIDEYGTTHLSTEEISKLVEALGGRDGELKEFLLRAHELKLRLVLEGD